MGRGGVGWGGVVRCGAVGWGGVVVGWWWGRGVVEWYWPTANLEVHGCQLDMIEEKLEAVSLVGFGGRVCGSALEVQG